jgi:hypothetical protein
MIQMTIAGRTPAELRIIANALNQLADLHDQGNPGSTAEVAVSPADKQTMSAAEYVAKIDEDASAAASVATIEKAKRAKKPAPVAEDLPITKKTEPADTPAGAPAATDGEQPAAPPDAAAPAPVVQACAPPVKITLEQVRAKLAAISMGGKAAAIRDLIASYGVATLSAVKPEDFLDIVERAEAL